MTSISENKIICLKFLESLDAKIFSKEDVLHWFRTLCCYLERMILSVLEWIKRYKLQKNQRDLLLLQLSQLITHLSLLINVFIEETHSEMILRESRVCVKRQISQCLDGIEESVLSRNKHISDPSDNFIRWMDTALEKISEISVTFDRHRNVEILKEAKSIFEEVLCHAMSIAQIGSSEDYKIIKGGSQMVLEVLELLIKEINSDDCQTTMVNLYVDSCSDKLCALERKVNTTVLRLSLKVFSEYYDTLNAINDYCMNKQCRNKTPDWDTLVMEFDFHVDRIMQVGLFAVSCSTCDNLNIKIKSCLASLEALESELVPSFNATLLENSPHNISHAMLLKKHWMQQAKQLKHHIYSILDPFAFCEVVFEENKKLVSEITELIETKQEYVIKDLVEKYIKQSIVLQSFIKTIHDIGDFEKRTLEQVFPDFEKVLHETISSKTHLLGKIITIDEKNAHSRVLKRCKILLSITKRLVSCFAEAEMKNIETCDNSNSKGNSVIVEHPDLTHIIDKGKQLLKDRTILYKSPSKSLNSKPSSEIVPRKDGEQLPLLKLVHLRKICFMNSTIEKERNVDIEITEILNELTKLSGDFS